ncbi:hypothetical protein LR48_Vigan07g102900 [Vigna angularis]|uniref:UDP-glycosyltransferases domain-containing protein n=1 Tax=Phaseolus angularis TaxID=3914 RepID=A0A0L9UWT5_PHAAN|nr:hypothetical protein LR48_Vigan07g102900 [Vigna angularis]
MIRARGASSYHVEASSSRGEPSSSSHDERRRPTTSARRRHVEEYRMDVIDEHDHEKSPQLTTSVELSVQNTNFPRVIVYQASVNDSHSLFPVHHGSSFSSINLSLSPRGHALPARGHINPFMNFCKLLLSNNTGIVVTFMVTEEWLALIASDPKPDSIELRSIPNVVPSELTRTNEHLGFLEPVMTKMEAPFEELLRCLQLPPTAIVADTLLYWAVVVGIRRNIPVASFWTMSASMFFVLYHHHLLDQNGHYPVNLSGRQALTATALRWRYGDVTLTRLPFSFRSFQIDIWVFLVVVDGGGVNGDVDGCGHGSRLQNTPTLSTNNGSSHGYMEWLDAQPVGSVLYISQGSHFSVSRAQIDEIAFALRESGILLLWIVKDGLVGTWCDQLRVLCHPRIGGFWSHCGWNSTKEGVLAGVPFLTFPIIMDQPLDSKMIVEDWKVGWRMKEDVNVNSLVEKGEIVSLLQKFMDLDTAWKGNQGKIQNSSADMSSCNYKWWLSRYSFRCLS